TRYFDVTLADGRTMTARSFLAWDESLKLGWLTLEPSGPSPTFGDLSIVPFVMSPPDAQRDLASQGRRLLVGGVGGSPLWATAAKCDGCGQAFFELKGPAVASGDRVTTHTGQLVGLVVDATAQGGLAVFAATLHEALRARWQIPLN